MADDSTTQLQGVIDRMRAGDPAARDELINRSYQRLHRLAHRMLQGFPGVRPLEDTGDVLHGALRRLIRALEAVPLASPAHFFNLASKQIRWELLDLAQQVRKRERGGLDPLPAGQVLEGTSQAPREQSDTTHEPRRLEAWREFHEQVERLPEEERAVFDLLWYQELTQAEAAAVLDVSVGTVRRRWMSARLLLQEALLDEGPG
jgi:RNA polymerase sigma-70 factor (ECF subfamily)